VPIGIELGAGFGTPGLKDRARGGLVFLLLLRLRQVMMLLLASVG
jgi:hypothetical protein